jgi:P-type Cu2+ transporter
MRASYHPESGEHEGHEKHAGHDKHAGHNKHAGHDKHAGHNKHAGHSVEMFRNKFWLSLALTLPVVFWSEHIQDLLGYTAPVFPGSEWIPPVFGVIVFFYGGIVFLKGGWRELKDRLPGMMTLISLAITVAFVFSLAVEIGFKAEALWWELTTLVTIMLLGHWMEMRSISQAQGALQALAKLLPDKATRIKSGETKSIAEGVTEEVTEEVRVDELQEDDLVLVRPGENVPVDGEIQKGKSDLNEAMITGESKPVTKSEGDEVIAGTINGQGSLRVRVAGVGEKTKLSGIMRLVSEAQKSKSRSQDLADRAARLLTGVAISIGLLTLVAWQLLGATIDFTVVRVVTVLVIACPHALGLAVPLVIAISTTIGAQSGLLIRDRRGLEESRDLNTVIFDKTGTLTLGEFRVVEMTCAEGISEEDALRAAAGVERESEHPIARGIVKTARERDVEIPEAKDFYSITGQGVSATVKGVDYHLGGPNLLKKQNAQASDEIQKAVERASQQGRAGIFLIRDKKAIAVFAVADAIREESHEAIRSLHEMGIEVAMLTGDAKAVADAVAQELEIDTVFAEVLSEDKVSKVKEIQKEGKKVAMVGDGVNDAPALATADIGIAIGAGTDVAVEAGHIVLVRSDPRDISRMIDLSKRTRRKMVQNLWWAAGYNIFAIPLAAGVLYHWGILISPAMGAVLMSASTVIVALNAQILRRSAA